MLDIAYYILFRPVRTGTIEVTKRNFVKIEFSYQGSRWYNISNILNHKDIKAAISPYFKNQNSPNFLHLYATNYNKLYNYRDALRRLNTEDVIGYPS